MVGSVHSNDSGYFCFSCGRNDGFETNGTPGRETFVIAIEAVRGSLLVDGEGGSVEGFRTQRTDEALGVERFPHSSEDLLSDRGCTFVAFIQRVLKVLIVISISIWDMINDYHIVDLAEVLSIYAIERTSGKLLLTLIAEETGYMVGFSQGSDSRSIV